MSATPNVDRRIEAFLADGPTVAPDHLLGQTLRVAAGERQARRPWWPRGLDRGVRRDAALALLGAGAMIGLALVLIRGDLVPSFGQPGSAPPVATQTPSTSTQPSASPSHTPTPSPSPSPSPSSSAAPVASRESTRVQVGSTDVTFDVSGWRTLAGEGRGIALGLAVLAAENPQLDAIRGVPHGPWKGVWLTRPTAWVHIQEAPTIRGIAATFETAMREAKSLAVADPGRTGDVQIQPKVTLPSGPSARDTLTAGRLIWTTTKIGSDGIDRDVETTIYFIDAPGSLLRVDAVTLADSETTPFDVVELVRTVRWLRPLVTCEPQWAGEPYCLPEPVMPASRSRVLP